MTPKQMEYLWNALNLEGLLPARWEDHDLDELPSDVREAFVNAVKQAMKQ